MSSFLLWTFYLQVRATSETDLFVDKVNSDGTITYSLADFYPSGSHSTVYKGVYIDSAGNSVDAVVKFGLVSHDASFNEDFGFFPSILEEISALRTLSSSPNVVRLIGTISPDDPSLVVSTRYIGDFHVVLPGIVLERLGDSVHILVHSGNFWRRLSEGYDVIARQLQCLHVQIFETVRDLIGNFELYSDDLSLANLLVTADTWRDERRSISCAKLKVIDFGFVSSVKTSDSKMGALASVFKQLDEHANSVRTIPGLAIVGSSEDYATTEPYATIRKFARDFFNVDATYRVGPDVYAAAEISEFVRKFPPSNPGHAFAVCGELADWPESWCGHLTQSIRELNTRSISV
jgi:serine/threonine protein kinase